MAGEAGNPFGGCFVDFRDAAWCGMVRLGEAGQGEELKAVKRMRRNKMLVPDFWANRGRFRITKKHLTEIRRAGGELRFWEKKKSRS